MQPLRDPRPTPDLKICGITDPEQAQAIAQMGVQAIGVIGVPATPRFVEPAQRRALFQLLEQQHPQLHRVWVVADPDDAALEEALNGAGQPSVVQLHGSESNEHCQRLKRATPGSSGGKRCGCVNPTISSSSSSTRPMWMLCCSMPGAPINWAAPGTGSPLIGWPKPSFRCRGGWQGE